MTVAQPKRLLLGPQRPEIYLSRAMQRTGFDEGPIAVISAAWQEAEGDIDELQRAMVNPLFSLPIYQRADELFSADKDLKKTYRHRQ